MPPWRTAAADARARFQGGGSGASEQPQPASARRARSTSSLSGTPEPFSQKTLAARVALAPDRGEMVEVLEHGGAELVVVGIVALQEDEPVRGIQERLGLGVRVRYPRTCRAAAGLSRLTAAKISAMA